MKKARVCHFTSVHNSNDIRIFHKECVSLAQAGFEVYLIAPNSENKEEQGVHIVNGSTSNRKRMSRMFFTTREVYKKAKSLECDIYHFHDPELLPFAKKLKRHGKKVIYDVHEDLPKQVMDKHWIPKFMRKLISSFVERYEARVARKIDAVVSVNVPICKRFEKVNKHVHMIANYPLLSEIEYLQKLDAKKVKGQLCYVGGLFPTRGIKQLVQAMDFVDAKLILAGNFSTQEFEAEVRQLPGWRNVDYRGYVNRNEIVNILATSSIGLVTLLPTLSYVESLPIKMFEYMASGIPMVASNFELWSELIETDVCGICVDPSDPKAIGEAVNTLLDNPNKAAQLGTTGRKLVIEKYNWGLEEQKLIDLYLTLSN